MYADLFVVWCVFFVLWCAFCVLGVVSSLSGLSSDCSSIKQIPQHHKRKRTPDGRGGGKSHKRSSSQGRDQAERDTEDDDDGEEGGGAGGSGRGRPRKPPSVTKTRLTHDENRKRICLCCLAYFGVHSSVRLHSLSDNINSVFLTDLLFLLKDLPWSFNDRRLPTIICNRCYMLASKATRQHANHVVLFDKNEVRRKSMLQPRRVPRLFVCPGSDKCALCTLAVFTPFNTLQRKRSHQPEPAHQPP